MAAELDAAAEWLGVTIEEILLAALGRTFGRTRGDGVVCVDVLGGQRWASHPVSLICAASLPMGPSEMLQGAHNVLAGAAEPTAAAPEVLLAVAGSGPVDRGEPERALELRVGRDVDAALDLQWWYDATRLDRYSVEEMAQQFPLALIEITSDAGPPL
ncbi:MAG: hypothetical protein SW019_09815 [Actinomycetota bacterium]|nr:hypothetical protein [Actinomycetota bacterium]